MIAGTGTINRDGEVGDIGGIDKKVVSAAKSGASIFFAPNNPVTKEMIYQAIQDLEDYKG